MRTKPTGYFDTAGRVICEGDIVRYGRYKCDYDHTYQRLKREIIYDVGPVIKEGSVYLPLIYAVEGTVTIVKSKEE